MLSSKYDSSSGFPSRITIKINAHIIKLIINALETEPLLFLESFSKLIVVDFETAKGSPEFKMVTKTIKTLVTIE